MSSSQNARLCTMHRRRREHAPLARRPRRAPAASNVQLRVPREPRACRARSPCRPSPTRVARDASAWSSTGLGWTSSGSSSPSAIARARCACRRRTRPRGRTRRDDTEERQHVGELPAADLAEALEQEPPEARRRPGCCQIMNAACSENAPRSARLARRFVATSARANASVPSSRATASLRSP